MSAGRLGDTDFSTAVAAVAVDEKRLAPSRYALDGQMLWWDLTLNKISLLQPAFATPAPPV